MNTTLSTYLHTNFCQCHICPRKIYETNRRTIDFINICCYCGGQGGNFGNVYHSIDCLYSDCIHSDNYYRSQQFRLSNHIIKREDHRWSNYQPDLNSRRKHSKFTYSLQKNISDKIIDINDSKLNPSNEKSYSAA